MRAGVKALYQVRRITAHMRQPRYLGTYLSERTAAAAIAWATKDFLLPCGQVQLSGFFLFFRSALAKNLQMKTVVI